ncbi:MAG TPA: response regulator transcription factor [Chitinophagales bacterium]|jgi:DNA-binding response OmpR family regulator|nr:response regulator transcription factor [Chitinophagales bacterium]
MEEIKTKILLVEDDPNFGAVLKDYLSMNGYDVRLATDGEKGEDLFFKEEFNLCILDVMMPKKDGISLAEQIKRINPEMPVIFLTAKTMQEDILAGFKTGADDYITKPFNSEELLYRIAAVLKRGGKLRTNQQQKEFTVGKFNFNYKTRMLTNGTHESKLSPKEAELLRLFCMKINDIVYREEALKQIWGRDDYFTARSMDVFVTKLRKYLKDDPSLEIVNIHGNGFRLNAEESAEG